MFQNTRVSEHWDVFWNSERCSETPGGVLEQCCLRTLGGVLGCSFSKLCKIAVSCEDFGLYTRGGTPLGEIDDSASN